MKYKILMLNIEFPPIGGGAGNANYYMLKEFAKNPDVEIDLVTSIMGSHVDVQKMSNNITIHKLPVNKKYYQFWKATELVLWAWKTYWYSEKLIMKKKYDLCHCWFGWPSGIIGFLLRGKMPYIVGLRGSDVPGYNSRTKLLDKLLFKNLSIVVWKYASKITANSRSLTQLAYKTYKKRTIHLVYNGIDISQFKSGHINADRGITFLYVGRLIERKGVKYLLNAFKQICDKYDHCKLQIVGSGPEEKYLEEFCLKHGIEEKVEFKGMVMHNDILPIYERSHVFVMPSLEESLSNAVLEAMACGLAIISTDTGSAEFLDQNGFVIRAGDHKAIKHALIKYASNPELIEHHGRQSRKLALQLDWCHTADQYFRLYHDAIQSHGGKSSRVPCP